MTFPVPPAFSSRSTAGVRAEQKRTSSPPSHFFTRATALLLASSYFKTKSEAAGTSYSANHMRQINNALFGQLMAAFEWCLKDFVAQIVDATPVLDETLAKQAWINVKASTVLAARGSQAPVGAILLHQTGQWYRAGNVNDRFQKLFGEVLILPAEKASLDKLWLVRHVVAHNAGQLEQHDAYRLQAPNVADKVISVNQDYLGATAGFLTPIVRRLGNTVGEAFVITWLKAQEAADYAKHQSTYETLKTIAAVVEKPKDDLPAFTASAYAADAATAGI